jgi:hypothetical protein
MDSAGPVLLVVLTVLLTVSLVLLALACIRTRRP